MVFRAGLAGPGKLALLSSVSRATIGVADALNQITGDT